MSYSLYWIVSGIALLIVETLIPVAYFLWFGISCFILALMTYFINLSDIQQAIIYAIATPLIVILGRRFVPIHINDRHEKNINKKIQNLLGKELVLEDDLKTTLQVKIDETLWTISGTNAPKGSTVKIVDFENNRLIVDKVNNE
jgi:membrane protein implicated in regulation of membrane protease activity